MSSRTSDEIQEEINKLRKKIDEQTWEMRVLESEYTKRVEEKQEEINKTFRAVEQRQLAFFRILKIEENQREAARLNRTSGNFGHIQELLNTYKACT